jgi:glycosyltransferase involved in cell wall biosynthesis
LALVVKLHTPSFLLHRLNCVPIKLTTKLRFFLGSLRRGKLRWLKPDLRILALRDERESWCYRHADIVTSPSRSLISIVEEHWGKRNGGIVWLPNPYVLPELLLPARTGSQEVTGAFIGRLEKRKGFLLLVEALRLLERAGTPVPFVFIGHSHPYQGKGITMQDWALRRLKHHHLYHFTGNLPRNEVPATLAAVDFVVLPSLWENFPYACLEAMGQEQLVLASGNGGMSDMINDGIDGFLLDYPIEARTLADEISSIVSMAKENQSIRQQARLKIKRAFVPGAIYPQHLAVYKAAISGQIECCPPR